MSRRAAVAALMIVVLSAAATGAAGWLQLDDLQNAFLKASEGRTLGDLPDITPAEAGKPQTIMVLGTDGRLGADKDSGARSDTIILARLDATKSAISLMSIPRDLRVHIPGSALAYDKINAAYANGGAKSTLKTVKDLLSRPGEPFRINHVVEVDFTGFRKMVDYLGCTFVDVDRHYFNDQGGPTGYATIDIDAGYQKICGSDALDYVRYRHGDNDLIRAARQQDFIRQLLRQPGVRQRIGFSKRTTLAKIAGRYTTTDNALIKSKSALISLARLGLGVADKPVQQVTFGAGKIADDGDYLVVPQDGIDKSLEQFMNPDTVTEDTAKKPKKPGKGEKQAPAGLIDVESTGETMAISTNRRLSFPFFFPGLGESTGTYVDSEPRLYSIRHAKRTDQAYRMVVSLGAPGEYYGIQGTTWKHPPILAGPHDTLERDGRRLRVYYDGKKVRLVAWHTRQGAYWVANTLTRQLPFSQIVAIAASLRRLK